MKRITFTVDAALLRELGERLVGKPHIALGELVKNSYDADATHAVIAFEDDRIIVSDDGHGMDLSEFRDFWMRVGSPHKERQQRSRGLKRPLTGSKGVGRLAVQFLARELEMFTVSERDPEVELHAVVDWDKAIVADELTEAEALYEQRPNETAFPGESDSGTVIVLRDLNQDWSVDDIEDLGREIWWLQPPFRAGVRGGGFEVRLESADEEFVQRFDNQMRAYLDIWHARIVGKLTDVSETADGRRGRVDVAVEFANGERSSTQLEFDDCFLNEVDFEIRVYHLVHRQPHGIRVNQAREYFNEYGGVHVYDSGFHLPYYGPDTDWLGIEQDHSHRKARSALLPDDLQVPGGLSFLPTQSRMYGVVHVNTSTERTSGDRQSQGPSLQIQVTRDRLVDNASYRVLRRIVRSAVDYYAMLEARRQHAEIQEKRPTEPVRRKFERVEDALEHHRHEIPDPVFENLRDNVREAVEASETEAEIMAQRAALLGSLATAGTSALAYEHETSRQLRTLGDVVDQIRTLSVEDPDVEQTLEGLAERLEEWIERARDLRALFAPLLEEDTRERRARFRAKPLLEQIVEQMRVILRGARIITDDVDPDVRLPEGSYAEWSALLQNVLTNAVNAMLDTDERIVHVQTRREGTVTELLVQDTGVGVDLDGSDELFEPFVRRLDLSPERRALGLGGTGLGLSIVRMIAEALDANVGFVEPGARFSTAFQISWKDA